MLLSILIVSLKINKCWLLVMERFCFIIQNRIIELFGRCRSPGGSSRVVGSPQLGTSQRIERLLVCFNDGGNNLVQR